MKLAVANGRIVTISTIAVCMIIFMADSAFQRNIHSGYELFYWESTHSIPLQYLTHFFLHGDIFHLLLNMFCLWIFGSAVERIIGSIQYAVFYVLCGIGAAGFYQLVSFYEFSVAIEPILQAGIQKENVLRVFASHQYYPQFPSSQAAIELFLRPVVGASGALYGVLVAFAFLRPNQRMVFLFLPHPIPVKVFVPLLLLIDVVAGFWGIPLLGQNIAHAAHLGGALSGVLIVLLWFTLRRLRAAYKK